MLNEKVGILGSGDVGQALGRGFVQHKYNVMIGTRNPESNKLQSWLQENKGKGCMGSFFDTADFGKIIVIALKGDITTEVIQSVGGDAFEGKIVIDVSNPLDFSHGMPPSLLFGWNDSLGERVQKLLPHSQVVKCWNIVPNSLMVQPSIQGVQPTMIICGNSALAKERVKSILTEFGWSEILDIGGIEGARYLENLVCLWVRVTNALGTWNAAFKVISDKGKK